MAEERRAWAALSLAEDTDWQKLLEIEKNGTVKNTVILR